MLTVDGTVRDAFPGVEIGVMRFEGIDNRPRPGLFEREREQAIAAVRAEFADAAAIPEHPAMSVWRAAYRAFGTNPTRQRPAVEALVRRVVAGKELPSISPVVDAYLVAELEQLVPYGGYDADRLQGDVVLRRSPGGEPFTAIGESEPSSTEPGEVVYADAASVLTRHWNHRDCEHAKVADGSTRVMLVCEVLPREGGPSARECCERVVELVGRECGGAAEFDVI